MGKLSTDVCPFCLESHSLSAYEHLHSSPSPSTPLWLLLLGIQGHCNSSFPSTEEATFWYTMEYAIYLESYRALDYLCFLLPYIFATYCSDVYFFLPIPHILVSTYLRVLNSLSPKLNLSRYQMSHTGESDTHNCSFLHAFVSLYFHNFTISILKHP